MWCKTCHYELDSLDAVEAVMERRCPECGGEFGPSEPATRTSRNPRACLLWALVLVAALIVMFLFVEYVLVPRAF